MIGWAEFRPEGETRPASAGGLSYRIADRGHPAAAHDEAPEQRTPVMVRLGPADLATVDTVIIAGIVNSRAEGLRWALSRLREHPVYARLQQQGRTTTPRPREGIHAWSKENARLNETSQEPAS